MKIYRIRKTKYGQRPAPGVGKRLAIALGLDPMEDVRTSRSGPDSVGYNEVVINYGNSIVPQWAQKVRWINHPRLISQASNKITCLKVLDDKNVESIQWTENMDDAKDWARHGRVFCRTIINGKKGNGIVVATNPDEVVPAPLYTLEYQKDREFRVHVFRNREGWLEVIDYVQKKRRQAFVNAGKINEDIRNHGRGWVFAHENIYDSRRVRDVAIRAVAALGLDFAGVDILARVSGKKVDHAVVCEVNSAPGMSSPTTFRAYVNAFSAWS